MKKICLVIVCLLLAVALVGCKPSGQTQKYKDTTPQQISFSFKLSGDQYFCQIIGNDIYVYEDLGENFFGRFFEYNDGNYKFYYRTYTDERGWVDVSRDYADYTVSGRDSVLKIFNGIGYAFDVEALNNELYTLKGSRTICGIECDMFGDGSIAYCYDKKDNMILQILDPDSHFYFEVLNMTTAPGEFLDSPSHPIAGKINPDSVFGK